MWHVQLCSRFDVDHWPQGQIYRLLSCLHVRLVTSVRFDIGIPYLAHGSITMRGCVKYIHGPNTMLTFDLKVKFIGFMTWLCVQALAFLSLDILLLCLAHECNTIVPCVAYIHEFCITLTFDLNIKIIASAASSYDNACTKRVTWLAHSSTIDFWLFFFSRLPWCLEA